MASSRAVKDSLRRRPVVGRYRGLKTIGHSGQYGGYRSDFVRFPDQRTTVVCLCHVAQAEPFKLTRQGADIYLAGRFKDDALPAVAVPVEALRILTGTFLNWKTKSLWTLSLENSKLMAGAEGSRFELAPVGENRFRGHGDAGPVRVQFRAGEMLVMLVHDEWNTPPVFEHVELVTPTPEQLRDYEGLFHCASISTARATCAL